MVSLASRSPIPQQPALPRRERMSFGGFLQTMTTLTGTPRAPPPPPSRDPWVGEAPSSACRVSPPPLPALPAAFGKPFATAAERHRRGERWCTASRPQRVRRKAQVVLPPLSKLQIVLKITFGAAACAAVVRSLMEGARNRRIDAEINHKLQVKSIKSAARRAIRHWDSQAPLWYKVVDSVLTILSFVAFCTILFLRGAHLVESPQRYGLYMLVQGMFYFIEIFFVVDYMCRFWSRKGMRSEWFVRGQSLVDLLALLGAFIPWLPDAMSCLRLLRLMRLVRRWRDKCPLSVSSAEVPATVRLIAALTLVLLQLGSTLTVAACVLWEVEGINKLNSNLWNFGDAVYYMLCVFTGQGCPFPPATPRGRLVSSVAILVGLCVVPLSLAELIFGLRLSGAEMLVPSTSSGRAGFSADEERKFWAVQLRRLDRLYDAGLLSQGEALQLREMVLGRQPRLAILCQAYGKFDVDNDSLDDEDTAEESSVQRFAHELRAELFLHGRKMDQGGIPRAQSQGFGLAQILNGFSRPSVQSSTALRTVPKQSVAIQPLNGNAAVRAL
eukprot:CAMPEP_0178412118 /NCGR_PEP_ID=MMETSP0689_2-20121128/21846_1 /TAXON_ID=160604 /ORGANISM="Amphidinium massartii, Strain CS-259" /LENGTH=554 /DNA_ID=CAMNT_0020033347 /DNA_START=47 /DNA_END=1707 /DNA_ORIENTATION=+